MPLIHSRSKKALQKNINTEMHTNPESDKHSQNLAIAYNIQRQAKAKKMADGGQAQPSPSPVPIDKDKAKQVSDSFKSVFAEGGEVYRSNSQDKRNSGNESMIEELMRRRKEKFGPDLGDQESEDESSTPKQDMLSAAERDDYSIEGKFANGGMVDMLRHGDNEDPIGKRTEFKPGMDENSSFKHKDSAMEQSYDSAQHDGDGKRAKDTEYPVSHSKESSYAKGGEVDDVRHLDNPSRYNYDYPVSKDENYAMGGSVDNARHGAEDMTGIDKDTDNVITHDEDSDIAYAEGGRVVGSNSMESEDEAQHDADTAHLRYSKGGDVDNQTPPRNPKSHEMERYAGGGEAVHDYEESDPREMFVKRRKALLKRAMED